MTWSLLGGIVTGSFVPIATLHLCLLHCSFTLVVETRATIYWGNKNSHKTVPINTFITKYCVEGGIRMASSERRTTTRSVMCWLLYGWIKVANILL
jgi:hypothetical protein